MLESFFFPLVGTLEEFIKGILFVGGLQLFRGRNVLAIEEKRCICKWNLRRMHSSHQQLQSGSEVGGATDNFSKQYLVNGWSHGVSINQNNAEPPVFKETNSLVAAPKSSSLGEERLLEIYQLGTSTSKHNTEENLKGKKRKNSIHYTNADEDEQQRDMITNKLKGKTDRKLKNELNPPGVSSGPTVKIASESSQEDNAAKGGGFHARAKRGQATNRHSLAERVRRERINERMRLLQDLVPGCNKVAGKAVMLDEIINYVQSLQCQVEFLAMKLATVSPGLNVDLEHIILKDVMLHPREGCSSIFTSSPGAVSSYYTQLQGSTLQGAMRSDTTCFPNSNDVSHAQLSGGWNEELLDITQMEYFLNPVVHGRKVQ